VPSHTAYPGTVAQTSNFVDAWVNPTRVTTSDDSLATCVLSGGESEVLKVTNFGFSLPPIAVVSGISVEIDRHKVAGTTVTDAALVLTKSNTDTTGSDKASIAPWPTSAAIAYYGGSSDLWGTTWTPSEINASTFGLWFHVFGTATNETAAVDFIRVTVFYRLIKPLNGGHFKGGGHLW